MDGAAGGIDRSTADRLLTTTRAVRRRLNLDREVPDALIAECLDVAVQAPSGGNTQMWRFLVVTDPDKRAAIAQIYRRLLRAYVDAAGRAFGAAARAAYEDPGTMMLADNLHRVPVLLIPCAAYLPADSIAAFEAAGGGFELTDEFAQSGLYASLYPAVWSFMLAARARGLGTSLTTLHLVESQAVAEIVNIPPTVTQGGLIPVAYYTGSDFRRGPRRPAEDVTYWDTWGALRKESDGA